MKGVQVSTGKQRQAKAMATVGAVLAIVVAVGVVAAGCSTSTVHQTPGAHEDAIPPQPPAPISEEQHQASEDVAADPTYSVDILIDAESLEAIHDRGQQVAISRSMTSNSSSESQVVWQAFDPQETNQIEWVGTDLHLYSTESEFTPGSSVTPTVMTHAQPGDSYIYSDGAFTTDGTAPSAAVIEVTNSQSQGVNAVGLAASIGVNGVESAMPFGIAPFASNTTQALTPGNQIQIFLTTDQTESGTVMGPTQNPTLTIDAATSPHTTIKYDAATGQFVLAS